MRCGNELIDFIVLKENLDTDDICVKKEWKAHSYGNLTKADQMMNDNKDPLKTSTAQPALTRPEERTTQKTKYDFVKDDKAEITEENSKCFKRGMPISHANPWELEGFI